MIIRKLVLLSVLFLPGIATVWACSMYKVSKGTSTLVGTNEDAWRTTSFIWFETSTDFSFKACFTGSRITASGKVCPQSGMNEEGLVFSRLAIDAPKHPKSTKKGLKKIFDEVSYLTTVLRSCSTVKEVKAIIDGYEHQFFLEDVFIYVDRNGDYLIVEPFSTVLGHDPIYVQANFCPSETSEQEARKLERYRKGVDLLALQRDTTLKFCTKVSKAMHVRRKNIGDGTLLTGIWNTQALSVDLYFYHDFSQARHFDLTEEFLKGDRLLSVPELFPPNQDFKHLQSYVTPFSAEWLRVTLAFLGFALFCSSLYLMIVFIRKRRTHQGIRFLLLAALLGCLASAYLFVMVTNIYIYYFPTPFVHHSLVLISLSSYLPFLITLSALPFLYGVYKSF